MGSDFQGRENVGGFDEPASSHPDDVDFGEGYNVAWRSVGMPEMAVCPRCGRLVDALMSYCPCGQAIAATGDSTVFSPSGGIRGAHVEEGTLQSPHAQSPRFAPVVVNDPSNRPSQPTLPEKAVSQNGRSRSVIVVASLMVAIVAIAVFVIVFAGRSCNTAIAENSTWKSWSLVDSGKRFTCNDDTKIAVVDKDGSLVERFKVKIYEQGSSDVAGENTVRGGNFQVSALEDNDGKPLDEGWYVLALLDEQGSELCELDIDYDASATTPEGVRVECS